MEDLIVWVSTSVAITGLMEEVVPHGVHINDEVVDIEGVGVVITEVLEVEVEIFFKFKFPNLATSSPP